MLNEMNKYIGKAVVFIGDFNTGKHFIDEEKNTFFCSEYINIIEENNYADAWRFINKDKHEFSWYSNIGNEFRIDHAYINEEYKHKVLNCYYSHKEREDKTADHSMMVLELDI